MRISAIIVASLFSCATQLSAQIATTLSLKIPGNDAVSYSLKPHGELLIADKELPVELMSTTTPQENGLEYTLIITAKEDVWFHLANQYVLSHSIYDSCQYYLPGFWYNKNARSPQQAPSLHVSENWTFREDRLSTPLSSVYDKNSDTYYTVMREGKRTLDALTTHSSGEVMLSGESHVGYVGFARNEQQAELRFGVPAWESPYAYVRKLTLAPEVKNFMYLPKGETRRYVWRLTQGKAEGYSDFVKKVWQYSMDELAPVFVSNRLTNDQVKHILAEFFLQSYVDAGDLKGFSGSEIRTDLCEVKDRLEVGFVGRVLLNAFNALEYGETVRDDRYTVLAKQIFDSYLLHGFTKEGFFREVWSPKDEIDVYSIRRQSEGAYAVLLYLNHERKQGHKHPEWEQNIKRLLQAMIQLQKTDNSFPRKFKSDATIVDGSGGSSPCIVPTLVMAATYFKDKKYMEVAEKVAHYMEEQIISKADYFSSTLDANCEDKEASYYAATSYYYLALNSKGKDKQHYVEMAKEAAYFASTWYYLWDVPFAKGQMLGDIGFCTRGWGNVSVENNHVDAYVFDFASVLDWLSAETGESRFAHLSTLMRTSMHEQLLPYPAHMCGIGKIGYHPEVVQHTQWDYGRNGKGYYNDIFAPGWVVASLWQLLMPDRAAAFIKDTKRK